MPIDSKFYVHPSDKAALKALKAIPGFNQVMKTFMSIWDEKMLRIETMSSYIRVSEKQMKKYHDMLIDVCANLGIEVPELYIKLSVDPNAYTWGDTKPFIVLHSGLVERFPDELIKTVIAHECGHIACHHPLYTTMGSLLLNGASFISRDSLLINAPLRLAFQYWMRCSEFSADRAAIISDGDSDNMVMTCMYLAGYNPAFSEKADIDAFVEQAKGFKELTAASKVNKAMELLQVAWINHPFNSVRAYEAIEWSKSENFSRISDYLNKNDETILDELTIPVPDSAKNLKGKNHIMVEEAFIEAGFTSVSSFDVDSKDKLKKSGSVLEISIEGNESFSEEAWFKSSAPISIRYKK